MKMLFNSCNQLHLFHLFIFSFFALYFIINYCNCLLLIFPLFSLTNCCFYNFSVTYIAVHCCSRGQRPPPHPYRRHSCRCRRRHSWCPSCPDHSFVHDDSHYFVMDIRACPVAAWHVAQTHLWNFPRPVLQVKE